MFIDKLMDKNLSNIYKIVLLSIITIVLLLGLWIRTFYIPLSIIGTIPIMGFIYYQRKNEITLKDYEKIILYLITIFIFTYSIFLAYLYPFRITWLSLMGIFLSTLIEDNSVKTRLYSEALLLYIVGASLMLSPWYLILIVVYCGTLVYHKNMFSQKGEYLVASWTAAILIFLTLMIAVSWVYILPIILIGFIVYFTKSYMDFLNSIKSIKRGFIMIILALVSLVFIVGNATISINNSKGFPRSDYKFDHIVRIHQGYYIYDRTNTNNLDTEHVFAVSWGNGARYVNDLHNLYLSNKTINNNRGNMEFGYGKNQFEPDNKYKGNIARVLLYMYVTYPEVRKTNKINIELMKQWNLLDPPDAGEKRRNDAIEKFDNGQNGRNIFIDYYWMAAFVK
ncbi:endonuclease [Acholeplasma vituli]|uniref:Endonuclease n=1 Tax=Paracholeplasma vituli TaxID=69473 RepID=A0ABT2PY79_9MOLU|nr:endonuclease [Paracholeplasma vituli]MCU0104603.1 endonuclease [Paracholeplasma vituli]